VQYRVGLFGCAMAWRFVRSFSFLYVDVFRGAQTRLRQRERRHCKLVCHGFFFLGVRSAVSTETYEIPKATSYAESLRKSTLT
jgi:hypothetical protein